MGKVRCVANVELDVVQPNDDVVRKVFAFGEIYNAERIELVEKDYVNVILSNGLRIEGVNKKVFENMGVDTIQLYNQESVAPNEVIEAPKYETEKNIIPLDGTILSLEDEEEYDEEDSDDDLTI